MQRSPLPSESIIATWGAFTLSTHRVWVVRTAGFTSMPIDAVECVEIDTQHFPVLLAVAAVFVLFGLGLLASSEDKSAGVMALFFAVALVVIYFATKKVALAIRAGSATMGCTISGSGVDVNGATSFLDAVERQVLGARGSDQHIQRNSAPQFARIG
jgi:hypothetical protein